MTILDLKKGDKVWVGTHPSGNGFNSDCEYATEMEVREIFAYPYSKNIAVRLYGNDKVKTVSGRFDEYIDIYATKEDFANGANMKSVNMSQIHRHIATLYGFTSNGLKIESWRWNEEHRKAEQYCFHFDTYGVLRILSYRITDNLYPTKEACEKANRRMVTIEVTRTYLTEREEEDAEWLLNHPDEYEFQEGDECMSDAQYSD